MFMYQTTLVTLCLHACSLHVQSYFLCYIQYGHDMTISINLNVNHIHDLSIKI